MKKKIITTLIVSVIFLVFLSTDSSIAEKNILNNQNNKKIIKGTVVFTAKATGKKEGTDLFKLAANKIIVYWGNGKYRQDELNGLSEGSVLYNLKTRKSYYLLHKKKQAIKATVNDLSKMDAKVKKFLPHLFYYKLEPTGEKEKILGHLTTVYKLLKSNFVRKGAKAKVWIADDINFPHTQYDFQTEWRRMIAPLPLSFGIKEGAVLKAVVVENGVTVTYQVVSIAEDIINDKVFEIPKGYNITKEK